MKKYVCISKKVIKTKKNTNMELVGLIKAEDYNKEGNTTPFIAVNNSGKDVEFGKPFEAKVFRKFGDGELSNLYQIGNEKPLKAENNSAAA